MSNNKLMPRKYYDRLSFTTEEKEKIGYKSNNRCCHCGKPIFAGYQLTVDHFIPLSKGGSNNFINLIPLCKECNHDKDDKIYTIDYVPYLLDKHKKALSEYLDSYTQTIDICQRHRLLTYDEYNSFVYIRPTVTSVKKFKKNPGIKCNYTLKYATWKDLDRLTEYFIKYLNKFDALDDEYAARDNIVFWMQFGCVYYVERNKEITHLFAITIKQMGEMEDFNGIFNQPQMYVFSYYHTELSNYIVNDMMYSIPKYIRNENNLPFVPFNVIFIEQDNLINTISYMYGTTPHCDCVYGFNKLSFISSDNEDKSLCNNDKSKSYEEMSDDEKSVHDFFNKFNDVTNTMINYFNKFEDRKYISWMIYSILAYDNKVANNLFE